MTKRSDTATPTPTICSTSRSNTPPTHRPERVGGYSNTNYILAGLLVQKVTGRPLAEEMNRRIFAPIGLRDTYFPSPGDMTIRGSPSQGIPPHRTRQPTELRHRDGPRRGDGPQGQLISTTSDLNQFLYALLDGRLLPRSRTRPDAYHRPRRRAHRTRVRPRPHQQDSLVRRGSTGAMAAT